MMNGKINLLNIYPNFTTRLYYIDVLKIISCMAVIILHISSQNLGDYLPNTFEWQVFNFYDSCTRFAVAIFVMVSGALFLNEEREEISIQKLYTKNIVRLLVAYIFYTIFYAIATFYLDEHTINLKTIVQNAFLSSHYHLWFIPMLIGIYALVPILQKITRYSSKKEMEYLLIFFFIFSILRDTIEPFNLGIFQYANAIFKRFTIEIGFIGYFLLGYYLNTYKMKKTNRTILYGLGLISIFVCIVGNSLYSLSLGKTTQNFYGHFFITTFFASMAIFVWTKDTISKRKIKKRASKVIMKLSNASFGIYLIHAFGIRMMAFFQPCFAKIHVVFLIPIMAMCVFMFSFICVSLLRKIPYIHQYIT